MSNSTTQQITPRVATLPYVLNFTDTRLYIFVTAFIALDVAIPWACHLIHPLAGATFLPMFFFTLLAGLLFGWRAGFYSFLILRNPVKGVFNAIPYLHFRFVRTLFAFFA